MCKEETLKILIENGYAPFIEDGVPMVMLIGKDENDLNKQAKKLKDLMKPYKASYGYKGKITGVPKIERLGEVE